jgi:hypothetical protein
MASVVASRVIHKHPPANSRCPHGEHNYDGPEYVEFHDNGHLAESSATCSKCGADAMSLAMWS